MGARSRDQGTRTIRPPRGGALIKLRSPNIRRDRVLVMEEPDVRHRLKLGLEMAGYEVESMMATPVSRPRSPASPLPSSSI